MFKKITITVALVIIAFLGFVAMQPSEFRIARTAAVSAPAPAVFAQVNDFHKWEAWSPWAKLDPQAKATFEGPASGTGAVFKWSGNDEVGAGTMTLTESRPSDLIRIRTDFVKPFEGTSLSEFVFKPEGDRTAVTWSVSGHNNFIAKAICLFVNMDRMLGEPMERGLAQMKSLAEAAKK